MPPRKKASKSESGLAVTVDGEDHFIRLSDLTALDAKDFRAQVGIPLLSVFAGSVTTDLDIVAGIVWLCRRQTNPRLRYAEVAAAMNFTTPYDVSFRDADEGDDNPEA